MAGKLTVLLMLGLCLTFVDAQFGGGAATVSSSAKSGYEKVMLGDVVFVTMSLDSRNNVNLDAQGNSVAGLKTELLKDGPKVRYAAIDIGDFNIIMLAWIPNAVNVREKMMAASVFGSSTFRDNFPGVCSYVLAEKDSDLSQSKLNQYKCFK